MLVDAVCHAPPGATLRLPAGIAVETDPILIDKPLTLTAEDSTDPPRLCLHMPLEVRGDGIIFRNIILAGIRAEPRPGEIADCTLVVSGGSPQIEDCRIESEFSSAVGVRGPDTRPTIRRCRVADAQDCGILIAD